VSDPNVLSARVDSAHAELKTVRERVDKVEGRVTSLETAQAVAAAQMTFIQASLTKIESGVSKVVWLVITGLITAVVTFVVKGGLTNVGG
jgi:hypothetical protein